MLGRYLQFVLILIFLYRIEHCHSKIFSKEEIQMLRHHSDKCFAHSKADPRLVEAMLKGEWVEDNALKKHVYCIMLRCKIIDKYGRMMKNIVLDKMPSKNEKLEKYETDEDEDSVPATQEAIEYIVRSTEPVTVSNQNQIKKFKRYEDIKNKREMKERQEMQDLLNEDDYERDFPREHWL